MNVLSKIWEVNVMNTISKRARRLLRPIAVRLVETWRGLRIDMTNVEREARGASTPLVAGRASALREGGSGLGVETPAGSGGVRVPREARAATCGLSDALSATDSVADRAPWIVGRNCTCTTGAVRRQGLAAATVRDLGEVAGVGPPPRRVADPQRGGGRTRHRGRCRRGCGAGPV